MNLRFVEAFYWVATLQSVTRAAEKLGLTQSAMSSRVAALESELGAQLLDRRLRRVRLTVAGTRFLGHARAMLELMREARDDTRSLASQPVPLRLGAIESVMLGWLAPWLRQAGPDASPIAVDYATDSTAALLERLQRGALDLAFTALPALGAGICVRALPTQAMVFVASSARHPRPTGALHELAGAGFMTSHAGTHSHFALQDLFRQQRIAPGPVHPVDSLAAMAQLAEDGFAIAVMPEGAAESLVRHRDLRIVEPTPALLPMACFASYRADGALRATEDLLRSILAFIASRPAREPPAPAPAATRRTARPDDAAGRSPAWLREHS